MSSQASPLERRKNSFGQDLDPGGTRRVMTTFRAPQRDKETNQVSVPCHIMNFLPVGGAGNDGLRTTQEQVVPACISPEERSSSCSPIPSTTTVLCSDPRCHLPPVPCSERRHTEPGFNSSCQQCLAERAEARVAGFSQCQGEPGFCQELEGGDYREEGQLSLAASMLSTKALVEDCEEPRAGRHSNPGPGRTYECEDVCRKGVMLGFSTMGVTVIMVGYLLLGAVVFSSLEGDISGRQPASLKALERSSPTVMNSTTLLGTLPADVTEYIDKLRNLTVTKLWDMTEKMNILYPANWTRGAADEMLRFQDLLSRKLAMEMMSRTRAGGSSLAGPGQTLPYSQHQPRDWDLARGLLYSLTLITTVGSGCEGVTTGLGRLVSLVYVLVGLPLMILYLGRLGGLLADMVRCLCCPLSSSRGREGLRGRKEKTVTRPVTRENMTLPNDPPPDPPCSMAVGSPRPRPLSRPSVAAPTLICVFLLLGYISCSAVLVARIQAWSFANAFYFCFMTLLTVGQGNLSPNQTSLLVCTLYVFIGLILVSTCWHIFQEEVLLKLQQHDEAQTKVQEVAREEGKVASARS